MEQRSSPASPDAQRGQWVVVVVLGAIYTWALVDRFLLALLLEPIKADLHLTDVQVSLTVGLAFSLFYGLLSLPAGWLTDRAGRRGLVAAAAVVWSVATASCGLAGSFAALFAGRAGVGGAEGFITPASLSLIRDRVDPRRRGLAFSIFAMGPNVGGAIALAGGGALLAAAQAGHFTPVPLLGALPAWREVLVIVGVAGLLPIFGLLLVGRDRGEGRAHLGSGAEGQTTWSALWRRLGASRADYVLLVGYVTAAAMLAFAVNGWMPAMMGRKFHLTPPQVGAVSGPLTLVAAVTGLLLCGAVIDRLARRGGEALSYGLVAGALATLSSLVLALASDQTMAWIAYTATIFFMGSFYAVGVATLARITPAALMGKATALYLIFQSSLGGALAPTVVAAWAGLFRGPLAIARGLALHCATMGLLSLVLCGALAVRLSRARRAGGVAPEDVAEAASA